MKKVLLSSVAALAVFAAAAPAFANDGQDHTGSLDNKTEVTSSDFFTNNEGGLTQPAKKGLNNGDSETTKDKIKAAGETVEPKLDENGKPIPGEFVVKGAAKDAKADAKKDDAKAPAATKASAAAAGQKALPKTSAVK